LVRLEYISNRDLLLMIRPLSKIILYTVATAIILFICGLYLHLELTYRERVRDYTQLNESVYSELINLFQCEFPLQENTYTYEHSFGRSGFDSSIFVCQFSKPFDSITIDYKTSPAFSTEELKSIIHTCLSQKDLKTGNLSLTLQNVSKKPYLIGVRSGAGNDSTIIGELRILQPPVKQIIDSVQKGESRLILTIIKTNDTIIFSSSELPVSLLYELMNADPENSLKSFSVRDKNHSQKLFRVTKKIHSDFQLITVFSNPKRSSVSILLFFISFLILLSGTIILPTLFRKDLQKQILEINSVVESISEKDFDKHISENYPGELGLLTRSINKMSSQLKKVYNDLEIRMIRHTSEISMRNAELRKTQREILSQNNELKSAYEALVESREKYEKLIDHLKNEYFFYSKAPNGTLLFVSPSVKEILGFTVTKYRELHNSLYTENAINELAREFARKIENGLSQPKYTKEIYDAKGQPKLLEVTEVAVFNDQQQLVSIEGLAHDITERQKAEEIIKEQEEKYRMLFTFASDFIFMYELEKKEKKVGRFIEANQYTIDKLGYSIEELREMTPVDLIAADIWNENTEEVAELAASDSKFERIWESKDGNIIDVEISVHAFNIKNKVVAIGVARDISDRKRAEEEIRFVNEELVNQKENLEALVDNLTQTQEQLVQSEKMAALGQLIAGIAHEINTPLGAIKASIGNLSDSLNSALSELPALFRSQSADNLSLFTHLFELARQKKSELSTREKRQLKRELYSSLSEQNIQNADLLSDMLIYLEIYEVDEKLMNELKIPNSIATVKSARNFVSLLKNTNTINIAVEKATKVVFALKKYAHKDTVGEMVSTDILDSIETVLTLYHNQLKQGVEVIKNYDKLPLVKCYQDEISQVWTNLVQNAIQAMHLEGTLTITAHLEKDVIWVSFKDTGHGIEPDIIDKIFDPFFTTKKQGEGSGLGLDIVRRIIEKHNWTIEVESKLGEGANFIIKIPAG